MTGCCWTLAFPPRTLLATRRLRRDPGLHQRCEQIRAVTTWLARQQGIPLLDDPRLLCVVHVPGSLQFDPDDWELTARAAMEGLGRARVLPAPLTPDLRGARHDDGPGTRFSVRLYAGGAALPPAMGRKTVRDLENYFDIGGPLLSAVKAAEQLHVTPRTICRWRALIREMGDAPWSFTTRPVRG